MMSGPQFNRPQSTGLSGSGVMLESYHKLQLKPKTVPKIKDAVQLIWSALLEKATDNTVKDYRTYKVQSHDDNDDDRQRDKCQSHAHDDDDRLTYKCHSHDDDDDADRQGLIVDTHH